MAEVFGARLAEARQLRGESQRALGEKMELSKSVGSARVNRYERGGSFVTMKSLVKLAEVLQVPAASLLAETSAMAEAIRLLGDFNEVDQGRLVEALRYFAQHQRKLDQVLADAAGEPNPTLDPAGGLEP